MLYHDYWKNNTHHVDTYGRTNTAESKIALEMQTRLFYTTKQKIKGDINILFHDRFEGVLEDENNKKDSNDEENMTVINAGNDIDTIIENDNNIINRNSHWFTNQDTINTITSNARGENRNNQNTSSSIANRSTDTNQNLGNNYTPSFARGSPIEQNRSSLHNRNESNNYYSRYQPNHERGRGRGTHRDVQNSRGRGRSYMNYDDRNNTHYSNYENHHSDRFLSTGRGRFTQNYRRIGARGIDRGGGRGFRRNSGRSFGRGKGRSRGRRRFNRSNDLSDRYTQSISHYNNTFNESNINHYTNRSRQQSTTQREYDNDNSASFDINDNERQVKSPDSKMSDKKQEESKQIDNEKESSKTSSEPEGSKEKLEQIERNVSLDNSTSVCTGNTGTSSVKRKQSDLGSSVKTNSPAKIPKISEIAKCVGSKVTVKLTKKQKMERSSLKQQYLKKKLIEHSMFTRRFILKKKGYPNVLFNYTTRGILDTTRGKKKLDNLKWTLHLADFKDLILSHKEYCELMKEYNENNGQTLETSLLDNVQISNQINSDVMNVSIEENNDDDDDEEMDDIWI